MRGIPNEIVKARVVFSPIPASCVLLFLMTRTAQRPPTTQAIIGNTNSGDMRPNDTSARSGVLESAPETCSQLPHLTI